MSRHNHNHIFRSGETCPPFLRVCVCVCVYQMTVLCHLANGKCEFYFWLSSPEKGKSSTPCVAMPPFAKHLYSFSKHSCKNGQIVQRLQFSLCVCVRVSVCARVYFTEGRRVVWPRLLLCKAGTGAGPGRDPTPKGGGGGGGGARYGPQNCRTEQCALSAPEAPQILFQAYGGGEFFCSTPCVYTQNTHNYVENSKMAEKHKKVM